MSKGGSRRVNATGRNIGGQFVPMPYPTLHSAAWRTLSGAAVKIHLELRSRFNGQNNGDLSLSLDEAARLLAMSKSTAQRAFAELDERGFIRKVRQGRWYGRLATTWRMTDLSYQGHHATRDWQHWQPHRKSELGTRAAPFTGATVSAAYRETRDGTATVPVGENSSP